MATPRPTAVLVLENELKWGSCKSISANLRASYGRVLGHDAVTIGYPKFPNLGDIWAMAVQIRQTNPRKLVFLDHVPHPLPLLRALRAAYRNQRLPDLVFHIYGDFTLYPGPWLAAGEILKGERCTFVCASPRHRRLLAGFLIQPERAIDLFPFPVSTRDYYPDLKLRSAWRKRLGVPPDSQVLLYSGRISLQKNVNLLIDSFAELPRTRESPILLLAGAEDDLDASPFGIRYPAGTYGAEVRQRIERYNQEAGTERIRWLGSVPTNSMNALYNAADALVSLSLHHDEDYGMAVAEAQCTGLPCLLSDWGGFSTFIHEADHGTLIPVTMAKRGLRFSRKALKTKFAAFLSSASRCDRRKLAEHHRKGFAASAGSAALNQILERVPDRFRGFSGLLSRLAFAASSETHPTFSRGPGRGSLYEKIYEPYYE